MISLCVPTRGRPDRFQQMVKSATQTARNTIEVCAWLDDDDELGALYSGHPHVKYGTGPRPYRNGVLYTSELWTAAWTLAEGDIAMLGSDDNIFETPDWDLAVEEAFAAVPDRILMAYCADGTKRARPEAPFVSREWIEATGEFTPPGYQGWFSDVWLWTMAAQVERVTYLSDFMIRHMQMRRSDQTYRDGDEAREAEGGPYAIRDRFHSPAETSRRERQTTRLRAAMQAEPLSLIPDPEPPWFTEARQ